MRNKLSNYLYHTWKITIELKYMVKKKTVKLYMKNRLSNYNNYDIYQRAVKEQIKAKKNVL